MLGRRKKLEEAENEKECKLKEISCRQEKLISYAEKMERNIKSCEKWMIDMDARLERECMDAEMKKKIEY